MQQPNFSIKEYRKRVSCFKCEKDKDSEEFIKQKCLYLEENNLSRTYLILDEDVSEFKIKGFFSIAVKAFYFANETQDENRLKISKSIKNSVPAFLIGQLSKCDNQPKGVGSEILKYAIEKIKTVQNVIGGRFIYLDYKKDKLKLYDFYHNNGFEFMQNNPEHNEYNQMYIVI